MRDEGTGAVDEARLKSASFTSGLSINEFAACAALGLEPVQLVQGYAVLAPTTPVYTGGVTLAGQRFAPSSGLMSDPSRYLNAYSRRLAEQGYWKRYRCPHVMEAVMAQHLTWGANAEQLLMHSGWRRGFDAAFSRMVEQAKSAGAHGVIGVHDRRRQFADTPALEYAVVGTAVRVAGAPASGGAPWTTHLAGPSFVNLIAGGYMPLAAIVDRTWMAVWPFCLTKFFLEGQSLQRGLMGDPVQEVQQISEAKTALVEIARAHVREEAKGDPVLGIDIDLGVEHHKGLGSLILDATIRATRVRRFDASAAPLEAQTVLRLS